MSLIAIPQSAWERGVDWKALGWHGSIHMLGGIGCVYLFLAYNFYTVVLAAVTFVLCHLSIRLGAHSLYTHQAYKAARWLHWALVILYSMTLQGPLRMWVALHVRHHKYTDQEGDPYSPKDGWLWAHSLWTCFMLPKINYAREALWLFRARNPEEERTIKRIAWQGRYHWHLGLGLGVLLPGLVSTLWGDWLGGFLVAGFFRLLCQYHLTWQINSLSHMLGSREYSPDSSRNAPWWLAPLTGLSSVGEATRHNRHHRFPRDPRIGNRWYDFDVGKWALYILWATSQVWDLHRYDDNGTLRLLR